MPRPHITPSGEIQRAAVSVTPIEARVRPPSRRRAEGSNETADVESKGGLDEGIPSEKPPNCPGLVPRPRALRRPSRIPGEGLEPPGGTGDREVSALGQHRCLRVPRPHRDRPVDDPEQLDSTGGPVR